MVRFPVLLAVVLHSFFPFFTAAATATQEPCASVPGFAETSSAEMAGALVEIRGMIGGLEPPIREGQAFLAQHPEEAEGFYEGFQSTAGFSWNEALQLLAELKAFEALLPGCIAEKEAIERGGGGTTTGGRSPDGVPCVLRTAYCIDLEGNRF